MIIMREPMKDHSLSHASIMNNNRKRKDLKWVGLSTSSNRSADLSTSLSDYTTDASSCSDSVGSFADEHDNAAPVNDAPTTVKRRVHFAPLSRQRKISSHRRLSPKEKSKIWYNGSDAQFIRTEARKAAIRACTIETGYTDYMNQLATHVCRMGAAITDPDYLETTEMNVNILLSGMELAKNKDSPALSAVTGTKNGSFLAQAQCDADDTFRGLEDLLSEDRRFLRFEVAKEARNMVIETSSTAAATKDSSCSPTETARYYKDMSLSAAIFARVCADMDEASANAIYRTSSWPADLHASDC